jgi:hypothetical protein
MLSESSSKFFALDPFRLQIIVVEFALHRFGFR